MNQILDVHGSPISPEWAAEFRGFFWGDGSIEINTLHRTRPDGTRWTGFRPRLRIGQRADNRAILDAIQARLGGNVWQYKGHTMVSAANGRTYQSHPAFFYDITGTALVTRALALLNNGLLPHSKQRQIAIMQEYMAMRPRPGGKYKPGDVEKVAALKQELIDIRKYREP